MCTTQIIMCYYTTKTKRHSINTSRNHYQNTTLLSRLVFYFKGQHSKIKWDL